MTEVFLQIAGSLEFYGSPEPYLRHMKAEHERIEVKYRKQTGDKQRSFCPDYIDAAYFDHFAANWKHLAPQLKLESLCKNTGSLMRIALSGPDGKGTNLAAVFKRHQSAVVAAMLSKGKVQIPDFTVLQADLTKCLKFDETLVQNVNLTSEEQAAIIPATEARAAFQKLFAALSAGLAPANAEKIKTVILAVVTDVGRMAQSEIQAASLEAALDDLHSPKPPYSVEQETALNADERTTFAFLLKKPRFTKADLSALDNFYKGPYDRLSERGKDELSMRIDAGMRPAPQTLK